MLVTRSVPFGPTHVPHHYYVEGYAGWCVIRCSTKRIARQWGVKEFGRGGVKTVRAATANELDCYKHWHSLSAESLPLENYPND